jgi:hypothetical protein
MRENPREPSIEGSWVLPNRCICAAKKNCGLYAEQAKLENLHIKELPAETTPGNKEDPKNS